jgi:hypothetical protein
MIAADGERCDVPVLRVGTWPVGGRDGGDGAVSLAARVNDRTYRWVNGGLFAAATWLALDALAVGPAGLVPLLALVTGVAAIVAPQLAVALAIGLVSVPLLAADLMTGLVFLLAAVLLFPFLCRDAGGVFLMLAYAVVFAFAGPIWAVAALAGLMLGASEGAAAAALACIVVQWAALLSGRSYAGMVASGSTGTGLGGLGAPPPDLLGFGWLPTAIDAFSTEAFIGLLPSPGSLPVILLQAAAWAAGAAVAGSILRSASSPHRKISALAAAGAGTAVAAIGHVIVLGVYDALPADTATAALSTSIVLALAVTAIREWVFPLAQVARRPLREAVAVETVVGSPDSEAHTAPLSETQSAKVPA